jgi:hypothetical protein
VSFRVNSWIVPLLVTTSDPRITNPPGTLKVPRGGLAPATLFKTPQCQKLVNENNCARYDTLHGHVLMQLLLDCQD